MKSDSGSQIGITELQQQSSDKRLSQNNMNAKIAQDNSESNTERQSLFKNTSYLSTEEY